MKSILLTILLGCSNSLFSQQPISTSMPSNQHYLQKSKHQKTTALVLLGGGAALVIPGIIIPKGEITHEVFWVMIIKMME